MDNGNVRKTVRRGYTKIARDSCSCRPKKDPCCGDTKAGQFSSEAEVGFREVDVVHERNHPIEGFEEGAKVAGIIVRGVKPPDRKRNMSVGGSK